MTNKMVGRVGDTAVVGAGTYANNATLALSSTGHGELFIAHAVGEQKRSFGAICTIYKNEHFTKTGSGQT